jgi:2-methylcitrate dehydratase PrpD
MTPPIAHQLASFCRALELDALDAEAGTAMRKLLYDTIGTATGGARWSDSADLALSIAREMDAGGPATVLGTGEQLAPENAAFANGVLSHSLDYDTRHSAGSLHVGSSVVPAALAAAQAAGVGGRRFLRAVLAGYEVAARLGMACHPRSSHARGFHPTGTCGAFGATAAVGVVRDLSVAELVAAFGFAGSQAAGGYQCSVAGGLNKRFHPGLAARGAMLAVTAAQHGFEGPPDPIEGELGFLQAYAEDSRPAAATAALGRRFEAVRTKIKPYPVGTFAHVPIALLLELGEIHGLGPETIERVEVTLPTSGAEMFGREPDTPAPTSSAAAQFDMPFGAALALCHGEAGLGAFTAALETADAGFQRVMARTQTIASAELEAALPERYPAAVTVETATDSYSAQRAWVAGEPDHPLSWGALDGKVADLFGVSDPAGLAPVRAAVQALPAGDPAELVAAVETARGRAE